MKYMLGRNLYIFRRFNRKISIYMRVIYIILCLVILITKMGGKTALILILLQKVA